MSYNQNPVVIIGAGVCGLLALKTCKENGLHAICLEKGDNFGGLWRFRESDLDGVSSVARSTILNTSKDLSAFSDFPPAAELPNYLHNTRMLDYMKNYAQKFEILGDIKLGREVTRVSKADDFKDTGEWMVYTRYRSDDVSVDEVQRASAVMVCTGLSSYPSIPNFKGQIAFRGKVMHTHSFKDTVGFENKRVLVVGIGSSGCDAAFEVSLVASQVYLSTRRGCWITPRQGSKGIPRDFSLTRYENILYKHFPKYRVGCTEKQLNEIFDHELYNLKPKHRYDGQQPVFSEALPSRIIGGAVVIKGDVHHFTEDGVVFKGEEDLVYELDAVIFATGYDIRFPFLEDDVWTRNGNEIELYRRIIPPKIAAVRPTLAFLGIVQFPGPMFMGMEIQCRWMVHLLKGEITLPSEQGMLKEIKEHDAQRQAKYVRTKRHAVQVNFMPYMDLIANDIGCKPNLAKLFFTDHQLFRSLLFGPFVSYQYRLVGPHPWDGARNAILTVNDRMRAAFNTRVPMDDGDDDDDASNASKTGSKWSTRLMTILLPCIVSIGVSYALNCSL